MNNIINKKDKEKLTPEQAEFLDDLLSKNRNNIKRAVSAVLKDNFKLHGDDCISEVSLLAIKKVKKLQKHNNPNGWLMVASKKTAANYIRKEYTRLKNTGREIVCDIPTDSNAVYEDALYNIWMEDGTIEKLLNELTPREKEVYELLYKQDMTSKQAGERLGISASTVRSIDADIKDKIKYAVKKKI